MVGGGGGLRGQLRARRSNKLIPHVLIVLFCFVLFFFFSFFVAVTCADGEFPCGTACITKDWVCDNHDDCSDGADEIDCDVITGMYVLC